MNFFEQELGKVVAHSGLKDPVFSGRVCYGDLGGDNRVKLQFVTLGFADHYEALKATVLNRTDGAVDTLLFRFRDIWGKQHSPNHHDGTPYIWTSDGKHGWCIYTPTDADYRRLGEEVKAYVGVFAIEPPTHEKRVSRPDEKESVMKKLREAKADPAPRTPLSEKDHEPGL
jgi:hypothetical protein